MPASRPLLIIVAWRVEVVNAYAASPNGRLLARVIASSTVLKRIMPATGPKGSSVISRLSSGRSATTVGA